MMISEVKTIVVGKTVPEVVLRCFRHNADLFKSAKIPYTIETFTRDMKFSCPGVQGEYEKLRFLSSRSNVLVTDWDIYFLSIPQFAEKGLYFGTWSHNNRSDTFLAFYNDEKWKSFFSLYKREIDNIPDDEKRLIRPGFTMRLSRTIKSFTIPLESYIHLQTNCGMESIRNDYGDLPEQRRLWTERTCLDKLGFTLGVENGR